MKKAPAVALALGLVCCLGMECPTGGTGGVPIGGGPSGPVNQVTGERFIGASGLDSSDGIRTYRITEGMEGEATLDMFLNGDASCISNPRLIKLAINGAGELLALARNRGDCDEIDQYFVNVYPDATMLNGIQQPIRTALLEGPQVTAFGEAHMTIDRARDLIYVMSPPAQGESPFRWKIYVFEGVSTAAFDGMQTPTRTITLPAGDEIDKAYLDSDDNFYWAGANLNRLTNMSTRNGELDNDDIDDNDNFSRIVDITLDSDERLWLLTVVNNTLGEPQTAAVQRMSEPFGPPDIETLVTYEDFPGDLRVDSRGAVYIEADSGMRIHDDIASGNPDTVQPPSRMVTNLFFGSGYDYYIVYE